MEKIINKNIFFRNSIYALVLMAVVSLASCASLSMSTKVPTQKLNEAITINNVDFRIIQFQSRMRNFWINAKEYYQLQNPDLQYVSVAIRTDDGKKSELSEMLQIKIISNGKEYLPAIYVYYAFGETPILSRAFDYGSAVLGLLSPQLKLANTGPYTIVIGYTLPRADTEFEIVYKDTSIKINEANLLIQAQTWDNIKE